MVRRSRFRLLSPITPRRLHREPHPWKSTAGLPSEIRASTRAVFLQSLRLLHTAYTRSGPRRLLLQCPRSRFLKLPDKGSPTTLGDQCALLLVLGTQDLVPAFMCEIPVTVCIGLRIWPEYFPRLEGVDSAGAGTELVRVCWHSSMWETDRGSLSVVSCLFSDDIYMLKIGPLLERMNHPALLSVCLVQLLRYAGLRSVAWQ